MPVQRKVNKASGQPEFLPPDLPAEAPVVSEEMKFDPVVTVDTPQWNDQLVPDVAAFDKLTQDFNPAKLNLPPAIGDIVLVVSDAARTHGRIFPAIVTAVLANDAIIAQVFTDDSQGMYRAANARHDPKRAIGTWHFRHE